MGIIVARHTGSEKMRRGRCGKQKLRRWKMREEAAKSKKAQRRLAAIEETRSRIGCGVERCQSREEHRQDRR